MSTFFDNADEIRLRGSETADKRRVKERNILSPRSRKSPKCKGIPGHKEHVSARNAGLLPSGLFPSALASHQICALPSLPGSQYARGLVPPDLQTELTAGREFHPVPKPHFPSQIYHKTLVLSI
jgi:hypothetical protein